MSFLVVKGHGHGQNEWRGSTIWLWMETYIIIIIKDFPQMLPHRLPFIFHWPGLGHVAAHNSKRTWGINNSNKMY